MNFIEDFVIGIEKQLISDGVNLPADFKDNSVFAIARYSQYMMRKISNSKRTVHTSKELSSSPEYTKFSSAIQTLKQISEAGGDLTPYQSKTLDKFDYSELLLFDWGIQHLHLGPRAPGAKFSQRSGPLLFAMIRKTEAYFVSIMEHGSWAEIDLLNIVDREWPHLLDPFLLRGFTDISPIPTPDETLELRKAGVIVMQKLSSGKIVTSPGGGITTAKTSTAAMTEAQRVARILHSLEKTVQENETEIVLKLNANPLDRIRLLSISFPDKSAIIGLDRTKKSLKIKF